MEGFSLDGNKNKVMLDFSAIKGGIKIEQFNDEISSLFANLLDSDGDNIVDKSEIDNFLNELKKYAKDNSLSLREASKYISNKQFKNVKPQDLLMLISSLYYASNEIEESNVLFGKNGEKTIIINYRNGSEEIIYPDKTSRITTKSDNGENLTILLSANDKKTEIYENNSSRKYIEYQNNIKTEERLEDNGTTTVIKYENSIPKNKSITRGKEYFNYIYIDSRELLTNSKEL